MSHGAQDLPQSRPVTSRPADVNLTWLRARGTPATSGAGPRLKPPISRTVASSIRFIATIAPYVNMRRRAISTARRPGYTYFDT